MNKLRNNSKTYPKQKFNKKKKENSRKLMSSKKLKRDKSKCRIQSSKFKDEERQEKNKN